MLDWAMLQDVQVKNFSERKHNEETNEEMNFIIKFHSNVSLFRRSCTGQAVAPAAT